MKNVHCAFVVLIAASLFVGSSVVAEQQQVVQNLGDAKWGDAPPFLPSGAKIAVLHGDPAAASLYAVRLRFPANYKIPAHSHPTDEQVAVLSGALYAAMGDKLDRNKGKALKVGGFALMPAGMNHYAYTKEPTTILLYGIGPVEFKYVNPADDPRNAGKK